MSAPRTVQVDTAHYHGWHGRLLSPWYACLAIVRMGLLQLFRYKSYWIACGLGLLPFLLYWWIIYALTQLPIEARRPFLQSFKFNVQADAEQDDGYLQFMDGQSVVVMFVLAFSGSLLVGSDFRLKTLPFYLSRRIDRRHYIVGKMLAISVIVTLLTTAPALVLFLEYGMFTSSFEYWISNWRIVAGVIAYGTVLCLVTSIWLMTLSAYLQRVAPIAITWASIFLLLGRLSSYLSRATDNEYWRLLNPWRDIRMTGHLCFGRFASEVEQTLAWWSLGILTAICAVALVALVHRVRAVEIVK